MESWITQPLIGVYDKTGKTTEIVTLNNRSIKGVKVQTFAYQGAVCIQGSTGDMIKLDPLKLEYHTNKNGTLRTYATFRIPEGSDCDTRLWGETLMQRLNADKPGGRRYGEYVRAIPPQSPDGRTSTATGHRLNRSTRGSKPNSSQTSAPAVSDDFANGLTSSL